VDKLSTAFAAEYIAFLGKVWQATSDSDGDKKVVYPILEANQDKLNRTLVAMYPNWVHNILSQAAPEKARNVAIDLVNFSDLFDLFPLGNRASQVDMAIIGYELALTILTRADFPRDWERIQNNRGVAYRDKITGNRAENIDEAISCHQLVLEIRNRADFPTNWAMTQYNLGLTYKDKITGNRAENIDEAISCYQLALEIRNRADSPDNWAMTQNMLGLAYKDKITGNRAENIDEAISCYQLALEIYTRADFPANWAMTQNNLGLAYKDKITGNRAENIDEAISCYQRALEIYTRADFPKNWAMTQHNLDLFYFAQDWAMTQNNLGLAYMDKITGNRAENIDEAISCYQLALEIYTRADFPENWAMTQNNLGLAYKDKITGNRAENIDTDVKILELQPEYLLNQCAEESGFHETELTRWIHAINRKGQAIIQGPPGTGKTFIAEKLAKHLIGGGDGFSDIIQFHPAYTYEDFIEGLRPITQNGQLTYSIVPGRFLEFCKQAEACEDTCVLIIDEINRANLSQVFGELMYLLDDRQDTQRFITLASGQLFRIPTNVRIIGTMNTADRSIALVDNALRRRFAFIPVDPNYEVLRQYHHREKTGFPVDKLTSILEDVNRAINNKHYQLGISFFLTKTLAEDIQDIWKMEIEPYLEEYFFDNQVKMDEFLWDKIKDQLSK
jgi:tetratricopeptide (TPR) repeat protein